MEKQTILEWYQKNQKDIDAPCNGTGDCGRCKIQFIKDAPEPTEKERRLLTEKELQEGIRLACVSEICEEGSFKPVGEAFRGEEIIVPKESESRSLKVTDVEESLGIALDIGTTTIAMSLISLKTGECLKTVTSVNHQRSYGADVISRIREANRGKGDELQSLILKDIWKLLTELAVYTGMRMGQLKKIAIAGNTTMCHLLLGYTCDGLGQAPFSPVNISLTEITTEQLFEKISKWITEQELYQDLCAKVTILPGISAFVGADIVSGMYACDMDLQEKPQMLLDIGTNGEIVIGNRDVFYVTSTAAGPVFEGGNISCGMPAVNGAVAHIKGSAASALKGEKVLTWECDILDKDSGMSHSLKGICGSGLVDLAAVLLEEKIIDENGTLTEAFFEKGVPVENLRITQADIRELQMGKAAIRAGIDILWERMIPETVYLAGGFGAELDIRSGITIGLFPEKCRERVVVMGNTSLKGTCKFLVDANGAKRVTDIAAKSREIILSKEGKFEEKYILFMQFLL